MNPDRQVSRHDHDAHDRSRRAGERPADHLIVVLARLALVVVFAVPAVAMTLAAVTALDAMHGWPWLLAGVYLFGSLFAMAAGIGRHVRIARAAQHGTVDLTNAEAWWIRLGTAPLPMLAIVRFTALHLPPWLAITLAIAGWASLDALAWVAVPVSRASARLVEVLRSPGGVG